VYNILYSRIGIHYYMVNQYILYNIRAVVSAWSIVYRAAVGLDPLTVTPIYYRARGAKKFYFYKGKNKITRRGLGRWKKKIKRNTIYII